MPAASGPSLAKPSWVPDIPGLPDFSSLSRFMVCAGFEVEQASGLGVRGHADLGPDHHTPWGVVHGGLYSALIETAASLGASLAVAPRGAYAVGVNNNTDFLRAFRGGRVIIVAVPCLQGESQQLWDVSVRRASDDMALARGAVRLHNIVVRPADHRRRGLSA